MHRRGCVATEVQRRKSRSKPPTTIPRTILSRLSAGCCSPRRYCHRTRAPNNRRNERLPWMVYHGKDRVSREQRNGGKGEREAAARQRQLEISILHRVRWCHGLQQAPKFAEFHPPYFLNPIFVLHARVRSRLVVPPEMLTPPPEARFLQPRKTTPRKVTSKLLVTATQAPANESEVDE